MAAFAYSGDQQIEVIQPLDDSPSIYRDYLDAHPDGGLQHLAFWCDTIAGTLAELEAAGLPFVVRQTYGDGHAYLDSATHPGVMMQLMKRGERIEELFSIIRHGADTWDGVTDPVRRIDWSTGRPVVKAI